MVVESLKPNIDEDESVDQEKVLEGDNVEDFVVQSLSPKPDLGLDEKINDEEVFESDTFEKDGEMDHEEFYTTGEKEKEPVNNSDYDVDDDFYDKIDQRLDTFTSVNLIATN